ncbi:MAG: hypothetical protein VCA34_08335, partial [Roseibacillus sp.]
GQLEASLAVKIELEKMVPPVNESRYATLEISGAGGSVSVRDLIEGAERLSGGYKPKFNKVSEKLAETQYVRVPWQSKHNWKIKATSDGIVYTISPSEESLEATGKVWKRVHTAVDGPYLKRVFETRLERGDEIELAGYELSLIGKELVLK